MKSIFLLKKTKQRIHMLGRKRIAVVLLLVMLGAASLIGFFTAAPKSSSDTQKPLSQKQPVVAEAPAPKQPGEQTAGQTESPADVNTQVPSQPRPGSTSNPASGGAAPQPQAAVSVNVTVLGSTSFSLSLPASSNQCDVLTNGLNSGKLAQLNMRYNSGYGSYGVYQINGIGKTDQVWWTFRVNGVSPAKGCSYVPVKNYDQIVWEYVGP